LLARSRTHVVLELIGGLRVGEALGGGDGHGLLAPNCCLLEPLTAECADLGTTIEAHIEDSKTGPGGRYVNFVGTSRTLGMAAARHLRDLWQVSGMELETFVDGGFRVTRPDYYVVRVDLLGVSRAEFARLYAEIGAASDGPLFAHARVTLRYLKERKLAADIAEERRYVNVAGGARRSEGVVAAEAWLRARGFGARVHVVAGPLLRATEPGSGKLTHMPLTPGSSYVHHVGALRAAYEISARMEAPDLELDLQGEDAPHFANHSLRRHADRVARETRAQTGASEMDIDVVFGWNEAERRKNMQLHYQGLDRVQRVRRACVTMML
jgi:hypothetical protein